MFHMQLHPDSSGPETIDRARAALDGRNPLIGLDWFETGIHDGVPLDDLTDDEVQQVRNAYREKYDGEGSTANLLAFKRLSVGEIGLIRGGKTPVALIEVTGSYRFQAETTDRHWFRHRFPVRVLGWYAVDQSRYGLELSPPSQGTFQPLVYDSQTRQAVEGWFACIRRSHVIETLRQFRQICLSGPPGTGKTHRARELAAEALGLASGRTEFNGERGTRWDIVQFHPAYNYEDFVRGISAKADDHGQMSFSVVDRIFATMCARAEKDEKTHVLIIDEINRAHLPAVLGELLYALEYRGEPIKLASGGSLTVPPNLLIIGTMNTADRSIGHLDYAVRRRFAFVRCDPDRNEVRYDDTALQEHALDAFREVERIFGKFRSPDAATSDVRPGHTYFMNASDEDALRRKISAQVVPLLEEYVADGILLAGAAEDIEAFRTAFGAP